MIFISIIIAKKTLWIFWSLALDQSFKNIDCFIKDLVLKDLQIIWNDKWKEYIVRNIFKIQSNYYNEQRIRRIDRYVAPNRVSIRNIQKIDWIIRSNNFFLKTQFNYIIRFLYFSSFWFNWKSDWNLNIPWLFLCKL